MTYTTGLDFLIDEGTGKASTIWTISANLSTHTKRYPHELFGLGMASRLAVRGYVLLICLGSLVRV
jgi:hypothetical protein